MIVKQFMYVNFKFLGLIFKWLSNYFFIGIYHIDYINNARLFVYAVKTLKSKEKIYII